MESIDKVFQEQLKDFEKTPSINAWEKINSNLDENQKKPVYVWYYVAACISLILLFGVAYLNRTADFSKKSTASLPKIDKRPAKVLATSSSPSFNSIKEKPAPISHVSDQSIAQKKNLTLENSREITASKENDGIFNEPLIVNKNEVLALNSDVITFKAEEEDKISITETELVNTVAPIEVIIKKGNVASTSLLNSDSTQKAKNKWGKVYEQVVNLKNGDKVNLQEFTGLLAFHKKDKETQNK